MRGWDPVKSKTVNQGWRWHSGGLEREQDAQFRRKGFSRDVMTGKVYGV